MAPTAPGSKLILTEREKDMLISCLNNLKGNISQLIDWKKVVAECGYGSIGSAQTRFNTIRAKKLGRSLDCGDERGKTPQTPKAKKRKSSADDEGEPGAASETTTAKKTKIASGTPKKVAAQAKTSHDMENPGQPQHGDAILGGVDASIKVESETVSRRASSRE